MAAAPLRSVVLYYKYVEIVDPEAFATEQRGLCAALGLAGRVRVASEGMNGTLGGDASKVDAYVAAMSADPRFMDVDWKLSHVVEETRRSCDDDDISVDDGANASVAGEHPSSRRKPLFEDDALTVSAARRNTLSRRVHALAAN